jgi:hypothetical protein
MLYDALFSLPISVAAGLRYAFMSSAPGIAMLESERPLCNLA